MVSGPHQFHKLFEEISVLFFIMAMYFYSYSSFSISLPTFIFWFWTMAHSNSCEVKDASSWFRYSLLCWLMIMNTIWLAICILSLETCPFRYLYTFNWVIVFMFLSYRSSWYVLNINVLQDTRFASILSSPKVKSLSIYLYLWPQH